MTVALDAIGPSSTGQAAISAGNTSTWLHTVGAGANQVLYVGIAVGFFSTDTSGSTTAATYNGVAMTSIGKVKSNNSGNGYVEVFRLIAPPQGAHTVSVVCSTSPTSMVGGSLSYNGANQTTPNTTPVTNFGSGTNPNCSVTGGAVGDLALNFACCGSAFTASNGTVEIQNNFSTQSGAGCMSCSQFAGSASAVSMGYTAGNDWWGIVGFDIKAATGGSTVNASVAAASTSQTAAGAKLTEQATVAEASTSQTTVADKLTEQAAVHAASTSQTTATPTPVAGSVVEASTSQATAGASLTEVATAAAASIASTTVGAALTEQAQASAASTSSAVVAADTIAPGASSAVSTSGASVGATLTEQATVHALSTSQLSADASGSGNVDASVAAGSTSSATVGVSISEFAAVAAASKSSASAEVIITVNPSVAMTSASEASVEALVTMPAGVAALSTSQASATAFENAMPSVAVISTSEAVVDEGPRAERNITLVIGPITPGWFVEAISNSDWVNSILSNSDWANTEPTAGDWVAGPVAAFS